MEKATAYYEKALEGNKDDVQTMGSLAQIYADEGETDRSVAMYDRAITAGTAEQKTTLRSKLGASLIQQKDYTRAADVFGALVEATPDNPAHRFNLGISLMQMKKHKDASPHLAKVIELRPDYTAAYQQLAMTYNETGRYNEAIATVRKGLDVALEGKKGGLYCQWGRALEKKTLYDEASEMFQRATSDAQWGGYAKKQIQRQSDLKIRVRIIRPRINSSR